MRLRVTVVAAICTFGLEANGAAAQTPTAIPSQAVPESDGAERGTLLQSFRQNWRITVDLSTGVSVSGDGHGVTAQNVVGLDTHKVITGKSGDWGTLVMQGYLTRADGVSGPAVSDDVNFAYRIFNLNVTRFARGRFNVRVGHFEIPFGLEHVINTNGTLRDFMHGQNLGLKADWGAGVNGSLSQGEYEFTWSRGTGRTPVGRSDSYVFAGRVGTPSNRNLAVGGSVFRGRVADSSAAGATDRQRVGVDVSWYRGLYSVLAEAAQGKDSSPDRTNPRQVFNALLEVGRSSADERLTTYVQTRWLSHDDGPGWARSLTGAAGCRFALDNHWFVSAEYGRNLSSANAPEEQATRLQLRYRF